MGLDFPVSESFLKQKNKKYLVEFSKFVNRVRFEKYPKKNSTLYGDMDKGFSDDEATLFFLGFKPEEVRQKLVFLVQRYTGRRISEVVRLKITDLDFDARYIRFKRSKTDGGQVKVDFVFMVDALFFPLLDFVQGNRGRILRSGGWVFFSNAGNRRGQHLSCNYARNFFRKVCRRVGLIETYAVRHGDGARLHRFSTHSFRHAFIEKALFQKNFPLPVVARMVGHEDIRSTSRYAQPPKQLVDACVRSMWKN